jgi:hypothetical protein
MLTSWVTFAGKRCNLHIYIYYKHRRFHSRGFASVSMDSIERFEFGWFASVMCTVLALLANFFHTG